ncbi:O-antigen ligase family protein [Patescibacteria group bacterium]
MNLKDNKNLIFIILLAAILTLSFTLTNELSLYFLLTLLVIVLVIVFSLYPIIGIYLMVFLYPFNYFEFIYGNINVPYVDLVGLVLFFSWGIKKLYWQYTGKQKLSLADFPLLSLMFLFTISAVLSLINIESELLLSGIKYVLRPLIFFYLIYIILPFNIIDNTKKLFHALKIMFVLGLGLSLMGLWSLAFPPLEGLRRVVPISIFGIYPLGTNHNLYAEVFVCLIPLALILFWLEKKDLFWKNIYLFGALIMTGVNLLTLSRAGWLTIALQLVVLAILKYRKEMKDLVKNYLFYIGLAILTPVLYLMYQLLTSYVVISSNLNRLKLIEIAFDMFADHPIIGSGVGSFIVVVSQVQWYIIEYGGALDAHGFVFKTLAEIGILGTFAFIALLAYPVYLLIKAYQKSVKQEYNWVVLGMLLAVIGVIIFQLSGTGYYIAKLWLPIGLALATLKIYKLDFIKK